MAIDYQKISDNDPGGDIAEALTTMRRMTDETTPEVMITYRSIGAGVRLAASAELESAVTSAADVPGWVHTSLSNTGVNVNDPQVAGVLGSLGLSADVPEAIVALGVVVSKRFPSLNLNYLGKARRLNA